MKLINDFRQMNRDMEKITMITAYDCFSAQIAQIANVDTILVGDSLGMVIQGEKTTIGVSIDDIIYHTKAVQNAINDTFVISDMPYMTYHLDINTTKLNAARIMRETRANAIKIEGGSQSRIEVICALNDCEIPVCGHLGLTPQSINMLGEYKVQGKTETEHELMLTQANMIEQAGAFMLVLECVPEELGKKISESLSIPVIGIGAGRYTDGQVMVWHDILGMSNMTPKFVKKYIDLKQIIAQQVGLYVSEVKGEKFPSKEHVYYPFENNKD